MNYNLFSMIDAYYKHHDLISDYFRNSKKEHFAENNTIATGATAVPAAPGRGPGD
jgi:hypothetical protein